MTKVCPQQNVQNEMGFQMIIVLFLFELKLIGGAVGCSSATKLKKKVREGQKIADWYAIFIVYSIMFACT